MDSTAFSMHFRSLAGSDSGGKFKTPTSVPLGFEERTPSQVTTSANLGNMMALTGAKKAVSQSSLCISKISGRGDSNDMSIVGENLQRYDCGKMSPRLDALLGEGSEDVQAVSESNHVEVLNSTTYLRVENMFPTNGQYGPELLDLKDNSDIDKGSCIDVITKSSKLVCADHVNVGKMNANVATFSADHRTHDGSYKEEDAPANKATPNGQIGTPNYLTRKKDATKTMASKDPEENCNTETEEESMVLQKRRSRRVSFAETTAIHIFDRDDEYETPPDPKPSFDGDQSLGQSSNEAVGLRRGEGGGIMELFHNVEEADGGEGDDDNDSEVDVRGSFLMRPFESPSPGSTIGSATSNDEDNFFGPVSADFIKPGQLSGSAASDENHDITMDSTAFSMHFRSLAGSDSGGKFKTPTSVPHAFEERTPSQVTTSANLGNMMALTGAKKPVSQSSLCISKISGRGDSNDMSIVGENLHRYDYGKISPRLDALLGEGNEDVQAVSESNHVEVLNSTTFLRVKNMFPTNGQYGPELLDLKDNSDIDKDSCIDVIKKSSKLVCADHVNVGKMNANIATFSADHRTHDGSYKEEDAPANNATPNGQIGTPNYLTRHMPVGEDPESVRHSNLKSQQFTGSPLVRSISSLCAKLRQIDAVNSSSYQWSSTHFEKRPGYSQSKESGRRVSSLSSFEKSSSRFSRIEDFPFATNSKSEDNNSKLILPKKFSMPNKFLDGSSQKNEITHVDAPVACLEEHFSDVAGIGVGEKGTRKMDIGGFRTMENNGARRCEEVAKIIKDGDLSHVLIGSPSKDKSAGLTSAVVPFSRITDSGKKKLNNLWLVHHAEGKFSSGNSSSPKITLIDRKHKEAAGMSDDLAFSSEKGVEMKVSGSLGCQGSLSVNLKQMDHFHVVQVGDPVDNKSVDNLISKVEKNSSLFAGKKAETSVPLFEIDCLRGPVQENKSHDEENMLSNPQSYAGGSGSLQTPIKIFGSPPKQELSHCQSGKDRCNSANDDNAHLFVRTDSATPKFSQLMKQRDSNYLHQGIQILQKPFDVCGNDNSFKQKRKFGELVQGSEDHADGIASFQPRPKFQKDQYHGIEFSMGSDRVAENAEGDTAPRQWTDVLSSFDGVTKQLLSAYIDKLDLQLIGKLEDALVHLQKVKTYEVLCSVISQKVSDCIGHGQSKRLAETKLLLFSTVYEKARLQLMCLTRDKLLSQVQSLHSAMKDSEILKSRCFQCWCVPCQADGCPPRSSAVDLEGKDMVAHEKVATLRQKLEVYDHLKKKASCQYLLRELQLWEVENLENKYGQHDVVLNYKGFFFQRFKMKTCPTFSVIISNKLNGSKILKTFPNIDACIAFKYVLSGETSIKCAGQRGFAQVTQRTSSLLHNLLDVLEEVELAQIELSNLTQSSFLSPSADKLDLRLCFTNFSSGRRVSLSLDVTCLNRGVYPSEILPYDVEDANRKSSSSSESMSPDIRNAVGRLEIGYMRIIRLCRCISEFSSIICSVRQVCWDHHLSAKLLLFFYHTFPTELKSLS
ncbi:hypothetical protein Nepgr_014398 [Nepenthes gracilis]|uniref:Knl1 C-terminal RWD domain-containing protein n=1 Tax=Nepenthes gracilis TaxID=150966 RepID=A0AAD3SL35_NEPGR|nr:hypothetical protein Nepgr_014398 [Nepenthes gracilis]